MHSEAGQASGPDRGRSQFARGFAKTPPTRLRLGVGVPVCLIETPFFRAIAGALVLVEGSRICRRLGDVLCMFVASLFKGSYFF